jgi:hypothetical protein
MQSVLYAPLIWRIDGAACRFLIHNLHIKDHPSLHPSINWLIYTFHLLSMQALLQTVVHYKTVVQYSLEILLSEDVFSLLPEALQASNLGPNKAHFGSS